MIGVKANITSLAKILGCRTNEVIAGQKFEISLTFKNLIKDKKSKPFDFQAHLRFPTGQTIS